jgi:purine-binding chemotaxis protein CheW
VTATQAHLTTLDPTLAAAGACSLLRMTVGEETLAVPIDDVREILQVTRLTPLPRTPAFVRGVMNLRGSVVPVIDLGVRLGQDATELGRRSCIVVVETRAAADASEDNDGTINNTTLVMGLLVDAVYEVFDRTAPEIEGVPALGTPIAPEFLRGMTRADGKLIGVLQLSQVLAPKDLADCIAAYKAH